MNAAQEFDLIIAGSGFAGSILAMVARRLGLEVLLIERGQHPRFVIGESSTPLTNLLLERIAADYDLPELAAFSKWGVWQQANPQIACGLKRGFSFYHHQPGKFFEQNAVRSSEMLVAASPNDAIADTHWYRPDFDRQLVADAVRHGVDYRDRTIVRGCTFTREFVELECTRANEPFRARGRFLVDASGPGGFLRNRLGLKSRSQSALPPTEALFAHFKNVPELSALPEFAGDSPYPLDAAAVHHCFAGGWVWVLRFNNGITSAGVSATRELAQELHFAEGAAAWNHLLARFPSLARAFAGSQIVRGPLAAGEGFIHASPLSFAVEPVSGPGWALLPSAAGFVDPLLSTGFPLTLLGILRLARMMKERGLSPGTDLQSYARETVADLQAAELLVGALLRNLGNFERFRSLLLLYFAPMLYCETLCRLEKRDVAGGFLLRDLPEFWQGASSLLEASRVTSEMIHDLVRPFDLGNLLEAARRNHHPADGATLVANAAKAGATPAQMREMLRRCGA